MNHYDIGFNPNKQNFTIQSQFGGLLDLRVQGKGFTQQQQQHPIPQPKVLNKLLTKNQNNQCQNLNIKYLQTENTNFNSTDQTINSTNSDEQNSKSTSVHEPKIVSVQQQVQQYVEPVKLRKLNQIREQLKQKLAAQSAEEQTAEQKNKETELAFLQPFNFNFDFKGKLVNNTDTQQSVSLKIGEVLVLKTGNYTIVSKLGKGGFGSVYQVKDKDQNCFALKIQDVGEVQNKIRELKQQFLDFTVQNSFKLGSKEEQLAKLNRVVTQATYIQPRIESGIQQHCRLRPVETVRIGQQVLTLMPLGEPVKDLTQLTKQNLIELLEDLQGLHKNDLTHNDIKLANVVRYQNKLSLIDTGIASSHNANALLNFEGASGQHSGTRIQKDLLCILALFTESVHFVNSTLIRGDKTLVHDPLASLCEAVDKMGEGASAARLIKFIQDPELLKSYLLP